jgi:thiol-disulfide isomerase/thioredoxin
MKPFNKSPLFKSMIISRFLFFGFLFFLSLLNAQNVIIRGYADKFHFGKQITAYTYDDLVTYTRSPRGLDTIDQRGFFEIGFDIDTPTKVELVIGNQRGNMYTLPNNYYAVLYPRPDSLYDLNPNAEYPAELGFIYKDKNDTTEINSLIINFNREYRDFFADNYQYFVAKKGYNVKLDSFMISTFNKYEKYKLSFFKTWLSYTFAELNEEVFRDKEQLAKIYLIDKPVLHENFEYMKFFNIYFSRYLKLKVTQKRSGGIVDAINKDADYNTLNKILKNDFILKNDTVRELVIIKCLYEMYYSPEYKRENIRSMLEFAMANTNITKHKKIITNMLRQMLKLSPGSDAPDFSLSTKKGSLISLKDMKGKYIYLDFMTSWSLPCLQEMKEISDMKKKYGDKVIFISISVDENEEDFKKLIEKNPKYDWIFLWYGKDKSIKTKYNVTNIPTYYFINPEGKLIHSPAITPTQGFEGVLHRLFDKKKKNGP